MTRRTCTLSLAALVAFTLPGCFEDPIANDSESGNDSTGGDGDGDTTGDGDGDTTGDGDGDTTGDGDGDGDTSGDGDGDTMGDGDGDTTGDGDGDGDPACPDLPPSILYDQEVDLGSQLRWSAQVSMDLPFVFEPADDIPVPEGQCWCVTTVVAFGSYWEDNPGPDTMSRVSFYEYQPNANPAVPKDIPYFSQDILAEESFDALSVDLPEPLFLASGRHWLSFMRVMDSNPNMLRWYWSASNQGVGTESFRFRAQGNTLSDCDVWQYPDLCSGQDPGFENFGFQLWGVPAECP